MSQCFSYPAAMTADELLSVFIYLIVTCDIPNWWEHYSVWHRSKWVIEVGQPFIINTSNSNRVSVTHPLIMCNEFCPTLFDLIWYRSMVLEYVAGRSNSWSIIQQLADVLCNLPIFCAKMFCKAIHQSFLQLFCVIEWSENVTNHNLPLLLYCTLLTVSSC